MDACYLDLAAVPAQLIITLAFIIANCSTLLISLPFNHRLFFILKCMQNV